MKIQSLLLVCAIASLTACTASEEAALNPIGSYLNLKEVQSVPRNESITIVGSKLDESGNYMPSFPYVLANVNCIAHISPVPKEVYVRCESEYSEGNNRGRKYATTYAAHPFEAGKTYIVYCNLKGNNQYKISFKEAPEGTPYQTRFTQIHSDKTAQPNDANRVRFEITSKSLAKHWYWGGEGYMSIRGWDGKFADKVELAAPIDRVLVKCQFKGEQLVVPLTGQFVAGTTYRLGCRLDDKKQTQAYVVESVK